MVFSGKASGGCHACRERKTRCDQKPEGCGQCANAHRKCPGYRKVGDVVFKDESRKVVRKFQARESQKVASSARSAVVSTESSPERDGGMEVVRSDTITLPNFHLAPTIEDRAISYFMNNYVITPDGPTHGHMAMLHTMKGTLPECLISSIKAVGLAGYSHSVYAPSLLNHARYQYVQALRATNEALRSPIYVTKDSTLISIIILSVYEAVTGTNEKSLKAWSDHIFGASALLKLRGREQLYTSQGRQLFLQTVSSLTITSVQKNIPLPDYIHEWTREARSLIPFQNPGTACQEGMMQFTTYSSSIRKGTLSDPDAIIARGLEIDYMLEDAFKILPDGWEYETVFADFEPDMIYRGRYHVYFDHWIIQIWNGMRSFRCLFHEQIHKTIRNARLEQPPRLTDMCYTAQLQQSIDIMCNMQADILATVPQQLGFVSRHNRYPKPQPFEQPWKPDNGHQVRPMSMAGPYFALWPLWYCGIMVVATDTTRRYVVRNLRVIGEELGIQQSLVLANMIENHLSITWGQ